MKYIITALLSCSALFSVSTAQAAVLTFDDVPGGSIQNNYGDMPTYQGFDFSGTPVSGTLDWIDVEGSGWPFGAHSGDFALLNNFSGTGIINQSGNADFTFGGLWAKQWNTAPESGGVASLLGTIRGFNNGLEVWSIDTALNGSYQFISGQAQVIDEPVSYTHLRPALKC